MFKTKGFCFLLALLMIIMTLPVVPALAQKGLGQSISLQKDAAQLLQAKVDGAVFTAFTENEYVHVLIKLREQADPQLAAELALQKLPAETTAYNRKTAARYAVVDSLRATAERTQSPILEDLGAKQEQNQVLELDSYFIVNMVHALTTKAVVEELVLRPEVEKILPSNWVALEKPITGAGEIQSGSGRQWNIDNVGAYAVWDAYGLDGAGVVVGTIDTGAHYTHEALVEKWRGNNGDGTFNSEYNWFDAIDGIKTPYDDVDHGTHVLGTIVGGCPATDNYIGVAPGAQWISAKAFDDEGGYDHWILAAAEYLIAPVDNLGEPNPAMAPDIINNSWGGGSGGINEWFRPMVISWRAAQILPVFSAGNTTGGSAPGSVKAPANYPESIAVAAIDSNYLRANFSNQGPGPYDDLKPDISAPGVAIRSSVVGGYEGTWSGTSMAAPHIAGAAALLLQADASLTVDQVETILFSTASPLTDVQYPASPNYGYGRGIVDAFNAVSATVGGFGTISGQVLTEGEDNQPPVIGHRPIEECTAGLDLIITAKITDDVAVAEAKILVQFLESEWVAIPMDRIKGDHCDGEYRGAIPAADVAEPGFTYKIAAVDWVGQQSETSPQYVSVLYGIKPGVLWDFEELPQGWYMDGDWEWGEPTVGPAPLTGTKVVATNLSGNYSTDSDSWLFSPPLDLRDVEEASLRLQHWYSIEDNWDWGYVVVTTDFEEGDVVAEVTGDSDGWQDLVINLEPYCGIEEQVYVLFAFESDYTTNYPGWYIDAIDFVGEDEEPPSPPTALEAVATATGITLTWAPAPEIDVAGYIVYRADVQGGPHDRISRTGAAVFSDKAIDEGAEYYYVVTAIDFSGNESPYSNEISAVAPKIEVVFGTDFEDDEGGFTTGGDKNNWEWGVPASGPGAAFSGDKVWATNLAGDYLSYADCWLLSPPIDLQGHQSAVLEFAHWYETEARWDHAYVELSNDEGESWNRVESYDGSSNGWDLVTVALNEYADETILVRFRLVADVSNNRAGWYIDDFYIIDGETDPEDRGEVFPVLTPALSKPYKFRRGLQVQQNANPNGDRETGVPVAAVVTVVESNRSVRTNPATGLYHMIHPATPEGETWTLRFEAYGFYTKEVSFTLERDEELVVSPFLERIPRGGIAGQVVSSNTGEPISGARIILLEDERAPSGVSDDQGNFSLEDILEGSYTLRVSAAGYVGEEFPVTVVGDEISSLVARLTFFVGYEDEIVYDDGDPENARAYYDGGNGWGVRFTPDGFAQLAGASVFIWDEDWPSPGDNKISVAVFDSLPSGEPGHMAVAPFVVEGVRGDWTYIDLSEYGFCTDQDFYIFYVQVGEHPNCAGLAFDESSSEGRTYQWLDGEFALSAPDYGNALIRANVKYELDAPQFLSPATGSFVNTGAVTITSFVNADCLVTFYVNGVESGEAAVTRGQFEFEAGLEEGENFITAIAKIGEGTTSSTPPLLVIKDTAPPELTIDSPENGALINKEVVTVRGRAVDDYLAQVQVNDVAVALAEDGSFCTKVIAEEGPNQITVRAKDRAGNVKETTVSFVVDTDAPQLYDLQPEQAVTAVGGETIFVSFHGDAGGGATFAVILPGQQLDNANRQPMQEIAPGVYEGGWQVPIGAAFTGAVIEFELIDPAGNRQTAVAPGKISAVLPGCSRLAGADRYSTAAAISKKGWRSADAVFLSGGDGYADALAGVPLAYAYDAPILLTASSRLSRAAKEELIRLGATEVIILGGEKAVSEAVVQILETELNLAVRRIKGRNRFDTAAEIAKELALIAGPASEAILASGADFPDALAAASYAAMAGYPILLTQMERLPVATETVIADLNIEDFILVGGETVISAEVEGLLPRTNRIAGANRYETAVKLAEFFNPISDGFYLAAGHSLADAITGGVLAAKSNSGLLLVQRDKAPAALQTHIIGASYKWAIVLGGPGAVSDKAVSEVEKLITQ